MTNIRITQAGAEVASEKAANIRVTQAGVEIARSIDVTNIKVTQAGVELARSIDITNITVTQAGAELAYCIIPDAATNFVTAINGDDIDLTWTENSYADIRIEHSINGVDYSMLIEQIAGTETYKHVAPDKGDVHYYRLQTFDGACTSGWLTANMAFGAIYTYRVAFEVEPLAPGVYV